VLDAASFQLHSETVVLAAPSSAGPAGGAGGGALPPLELRTEAGEVLLAPRAAFPDPLRGAPHLLVVCDAYVPPQVGGRRGGGGVGVAQRRKSAHKWQAQQRGRATYPSPALTPAPTARPCHHCSCRAAAPPASRRRRTPPTRAPRAPRPRPPRRPTRRG
jgi:hypothetical protein